MTYAEMDTDVLAVIAFAVFVVLLPFGIIVSQVRNTRKTEKENSAGRSYGKTIVID